MSRTTIRLILFLVILEGTLALRIVGNSGPLLDTLSRQQCVTAYRARSIFRLGQNSSPEGTLWRGYGGRPRQGVGVIEHLAAGLYRFYGQEWVRSGRVLSALFGLVAAFFLWAGLREAGLGSGQVAGVLVFLLSPVSIFIGRSFVPDGITAACAAALFWALARVLKGKTGGGGLSLVILTWGAALLSSPTSIYLVIPIVWVVIKGPLGKGTPRKVWSLCLATLFLVALLGLVQMGWLTAPTSFDARMLLKVSTWCDWFGGLTQGAWTLGGAFLVLLGLACFKGKPVLCLGGIWLLSSFLAVWTWAASASHLDALHLMVLPGAICAAWGWEKAAAQRGRTLVAALALSLVLLGWSTGAPLLRSWSSQGWGLWQVEEASKRLALLSTVGERVVTCYSGGAELLYLADRPGIHIVPEELDSSTLSSAIASGARAIGMLITVPPLRIPGFKDPSKVQSWIKAKKVAGNRFDQQGQGGYFVRRIEADDPFVGTLALSKSGNIAGKIFRSLARLLSGPDDWEDGVRALEIDYFVLDYPAPGRSGADRLHRHLYQSKDWALAYWTDDHMVIVPRQRPYLRLLGRSLLHPLYFDEGLAQSSKKQSLGDFLAELDDKIRREGPSARVVFLRGCTLASMIRPVEAQAAFLEALEINPQLGDAWNNLATISLLAGDKVRAADCLRRARDTGYPVDLRFAERLGVDLTSSDNRSRERRN